jgi:hypothetical protein
MVSSGRDPRGEPGSGQLHGEGDARAGALDVVEVTDEHHPVLPSRATIANADISAAGGHHHGVSIDGDLLLSATGRRGST